MPPVALIGALRVFGAGGPGIGAGASRRRLRAAPAAPKAVRSRAVDAGFSSSKACLQIMSDNARLSDMMGRRQVRRFYLKSMA